MSNLVGNPEDLVVSVDVQEEIECLYMFEKIDCTICIHGVKI